MRVLNAVYQQKADRLAVCCFDPIINPCLKFSLSIMYRCATYDGEQFYYLPGASILVVIDAKMFQLMILNDHVQLHKRIWT
jgi:hypothetical protein